MRSKQSTSMHVKQQVYKSYGKKRRRKAEEVYIRSARHQQALQEFCTQQQLLH